MGMVYFPILIYRKKKINRWIGINIPFRFMEKVMGYISIDIQTPAQNVFGPPPPNIPKTPSQEVFGCLGY